MIEHTPGPWVAVQLNKRLELFAHTPLFPDGLWAIVQEQEPELLPIAVLDHCDDHDAPTRQRTGINARLIAAAPDLLEALKLAFPGFVELHEQNIGCPACAADEGEGLSERCPAVQQIAGRHRQSRRASLTHAPLPHSRAESAAGLRWIRAMRRVWPRQGTPRPIHAARDGWRALVL